MRGRITSLYKLFKKTLLTLELDAGAEDLEKLQGSDVRVEIRAFKERRTLSQNAYYWRLLTEVAQTIRTSTARVHNMLLREHPRYWMVEDNLVPVMIPDTDEAEEKALEDELVHIKPTSQVIDGRRKYYLLRGSSTYDTKEMSVLVDDLVERAQELGIQTLTRDELERIRQYEQNKQR